MCCKCIQMPPKKKRRVTAPNHCSTLATLSRHNAVLDKQKEQYTALLKQLGTIVNQEWVGPSQNNLITEQVMVWISQAQEQRTTLSTLRDEAMTSLRKIDVLDNDTLKTSAAALTQTELQLQAHLVLMNKFERIVRYQSNNTLTLAAHTSSWITRFTTQWNKTNAVFNQNIIMLRNSVEWLESVFPQMVAMTQSTTKGMGHTMGSNK